LAGQGAGAVMAVAMALLGFGAASLLMQRVAAAAVTTAILAARTAWLPQFLWSQRRLAELGRFGLPHLADRAVEEGTETGFTMAVGVLFGATGLGYLNMAMRLIAPIGSVIGVVGHNVCLSIFARRQDEPALLRGAILTAIGTAALVALPAFAGLA